MIGYRVPAELVEMADPSKLYGHLHVNPERARLTASILVESDV